MKIGDLEYLCTGDVFISQVERPHTTMEIEHIFIGSHVRIKEAVSILFIDDNGEASRIGNISMIADWEYSHNTFNFGVREKK